MIWIKTVLQVLLRKEKQQNGEHICKPDLQYLIKCLASRICKECLQLINRKADSLIKKCTNGTSLVVQWLRICLAMQGTWVRSLVQEDPTNWGATKPVCLESLLHNKRSHPSEKPRLITRESLCAATKTQHSRNVKINNSSKKHTKDLNRHFSCEDIQVANKYNKYKLYNEMQVIREMQVKTTMRYYFTPTRMAIIKSTDNDKCYKDMEKLETSCFVVGNIKLCCHCGKLLVPQNVKHNYHMTQQFHC